MKKHTLLLFLAFFFCSFLFAQNLVLNPSFENINVTCSGFSGAGYTNIIDWENPDPTDTCSTPDWFSTCLSSFFPTSAPNSWLGRQNPRTGSAYVGLISYDATTNAYREYIEGKLSSPLVAGQTYCVSFYVSLADTVPYAVDRIGVYFSNTLVQFPVSHCVSTVPLPYTPQLEWTGGVLMDTANWVRLQWQYTATGGEQYFVIGNFHNNASTTVTNTGGTGFFNPFAYYFIDDVEVSGGICCDAGILPHAPFCTNGSATNLMANTSGGTWSGTGIINGTNGTFDPATAGLGTHLITYTLPCGASDTLNLAVTNCMEVCKDSLGNLNVSGGAGPYSWQQSSLTQDCSACLIGCVFPPGCAINVTTWQTFATGSSIPTPSATGAIQVVDNGGQTLVINNVSALAPCPTTCQTSLSFSNVTAASCGNANGSATAVASAGTAPYNYSWSNGQTTANATNLLAGTYTCYVIDASNCQVSQTVTIGAGNAFAVTITPTDLLCNGIKTGSVDVDVTVGVAPYTYSWYSGQMTDSISNLLAGTYTCVVSDAAGCSTTVSATVSQPPLMTLTGTATGSGAAGASNGTATVTVAGGTPPYTYTWQTTPPQNTQTITGLMAGTYTCTVYDAHGCIKQISILVTETSAISPESAGIEMLTISPNPSDGLFALSVKLLNADMLKIGLYDITGKAIMSEEKQNVLEYNQTFDFVSLSKGIYLLKVQTSKGEIVKKVVIE